MTARPGISSSILVRTEAYEVVAQELKERNLNKQATSSIAAQNREFTIEESISSKCKKQEGTSSGNT
jgi:hypothetical protein